MTRETVLRRLHAIDATSPRWRRPKPPRAVRVTLDAIDAMGACLGPQRRRRRDSKDAGYKPVPVVVHDERVVVARLLHLALLDQSIESVLY